MTGIASRDTPPVAHRLESRETLQGGIRSVTLVPGRGDLFVGDLVGIPVQYRHIGRDRDDLVVKLAGRLSCRRALLALQGVGVLGLAANIIALRHHFSRVDHGHVGLRLDFHDPGITVMEFVGVLVLHQTDGLDPTCNNNRHIVDHHALCRRGDGHHP